MTLSTEHRSHGPVINGSMLWLTSSVTWLTASVTDVSMFWTAVMTSESGVAGVAMGATTAGFDASAGAEVPAPLGVDPDGLDSGAAAFVVGAAGLAVAADEFVVVSDEFVSA